MVYTFQPQFGMKDDYREESQVTNGGYRFDIILNANTAYSFRWR